VKYLLDQEIALLQQQQLLFLEQKRAIMHGLITGKARFRAIA
jgi:hypothetical protein